MIAGCTVCAAGILQACSPVPQEDVLGYEQTPGRVKLTPPPSANAPIDEAIPDVDSAWAEEDPVSKRFDNMINRGDAIERSFRNYLQKALVARGFGLETASLSDAEANVGAQRDWWDDEIYRPIQTEKSRLPLRLDEVIASAVSKSHQIRAFGMLPSIRQTGVREAEGRFTPEAFAEGRLQRINETSTSPTLTLGEQRLLSDEGTVEFGVRSRVRTGAEVTIAQRLGAIDTNQTDFIPGEQSSARTTLTVVQPLLRGSGLDYNNAPTRVAELDTKIAQYELVRQVENHLLEVERAYWNLYVSRANLLLVRHLAAHGRNLARQASVRQDVDAEPTLAIRAKAAASRWEGDIVRAEAAVENSQLRIAALTNAPELSTPGYEFVTASVPLAESPRIDRDDVVDQILARRPEIQQAFLQYEAAAVREGVAANESLPELDLVLEAVFSGGADGRDFNGAIGDERFGGLAGLRLSIPLGYDERDARYERRRLETIQQRHQTRAALSTVLLEVQVSASEYAVAARDLEQRRRARVDAQAELNAFRSEWEDGVGFAPLSTTLSDLVGAYERASLAERAVARGRATLAIAAANFNRARGILLDRWDINISPQNGVRNETIYRLNQAIQE